MMGLGYFVRIWTSLPAFGALLITCLVSAVPAFAEKRVALVIGNSNYDHAPMLANPSNDASALRHLLEQLGFVVTFGENLNQSEFASTIGAFAQNLEQADAAVLYYAGHGIQVDGSNYLVSTDARLENSFALYSETMPLGEIIRLMEQSSAVNMVFLDACRDNPFLSAFQSTLPASRSAALSRGLAPIRSSKADTMIMYATEADSVAADGTGSNSPFASALIEHLSTPGAEISQIARRVIRDVRQSTRFQQSPELLSAMSIEFYFNPGEDASGADGLTGASDASVAFKVAESANNAAAWRSFLEIYPEGFHADLARNALILLEGQSASFSPFTSFHLVEDQLGLAQDEREFIQTVLNALGYDVGAVDGQFGAKTRSQIGAFQREHGLMPTGYLDAATRAQFSSEATQKSAGRSFDAAAFLTGLDAEIALALTVEEIRLLQAGLVSYGYDPRSNSGHLDRDTRGALRQYQFKRGEETDGFVTARIAEDLLVRGRQFIGKLGTYVEPDADMDPRLRSVINTYDGPVNYGYFDQSFYVVVGDGSPQFDEAMETAEQLGGHLAVFGSRQEREFVENLFKHDARFFQQGGCCFQGPFVGYFQDVSASTPLQGWTSVTGEPVQFVDWLPGFPNQLDRGNYGYLSYGGRLGAEDSFRRSPTFVDEIRFQNRGVAHIIEFPATDIEDG